MASYQFFARSSLIAGIILLVACSDDNTVQVTQAPDTVTDAPPDPGVLSDDERPNILLIVADDMGYSDIGVFGSEIHTPNIDNLAQEGLVMTNFKVAPTCSPTRSMLYSGTDNHRNGLGTMNGMETDEQRGQPGYETYLNEHVVTFMTLLRESGYHTYFSGKWQQGYQDGFYPLDRGFEKAYWLITGGANHFADPTSIFRDTPPVYHREGYDVVESFPENFYSANTHTDKIIEYIDTHKEDGKPFFAMASYTTPHWPLQVPDEYIEKYAGVYDEGYEAVRQERIKRLRAMGILKPDQVPAPMHPEWTAWEELDDTMKLREIKRMQIYAGMVDIMDENIGRLLTYLKDQGLYENTVIVFFSDNGAEGNDPGLLTEEGNYRLEAFDNSLENMGRPGSFTIQGPAWAYVSSTPYYLHKGYATEGSISTPFIAVNKKLIPAGRQSDAFSTVLDILPTFLDLAETQHPGTEYKGKKIFPPTGKSMLAFLEGNTEYVHDEDFIYAGELWNRKIVRQGDWKLSFMNSPWGKDDWSLYNLAEDIGEQNDLSGSHPEKVAELLGHWVSYKEDNGVIENPDFYLRYSNVNDYIQ